MHYIVLTESVRDDEFSLSYLRRKEEKFIFPQIPEKYEVKKDDVVMKLPLPITHGGTVRILWQFVFSIAVDKYNIN